ncbi:hypothetical protein ACYFX5_07325 [Bremerella sp. T1]|uniref:hypothetical protein n=1 Tax=Bremerella sp. TYQ1 TaxID=3119568 RepID=UPI001CCCDEC4|nr:hypothetical protein [Bremerella volcania]UBM38068.1 hypothetical protein LA756_09260 [Bremerella volcania]
MAKYFSIGILLTSIATLAGCSAAAHPLEGTWQGTIYVSGPVSNEALAEGPKTSQNEGKTDVALLTLKFLEGNELRLQTEPIKSQSILAPAEKSGPYVIVEELQDQLTIDLQDGDQTRQFLLRFTSDNTLTITEVNGNARLLPVRMTRVDEL